MSNYQFVIHVILLTFAPHLLPLKFTLSIYRLSSADLFFVTATNFLAIIIRRQIWNYLAVLFVTFIHFAFILLLPSLFVLYGFLLETEQTKQTQIEKKLYTPCLNKKRATIIFEITL